MTTRDNRPNTLVKVKTPAEPVLPKLRDIGVGAWFGINGDPKVYIKTDETLGRGYRCMDIKTGRLHPIEAGIIVDKIYNAVDITVK